MKEQNISVRRDLFAFWVEGLININPKYARKECQDRDEGQEEDDCPDCNPVQTPTSQYPKGCPESKDESDGQAVTDVHGTKKVSRLTVEM